MWGTTPPWEMTTFPITSYKCNDRARARDDDIPSNLCSSSSFLIANCRCLGMIRCFLLSRAALPANSRISAAKYSKTAAR
jgi:hypothetical protein